MKEVKIILVDDHPLLRKGVSAMLRAEPGFRVVGEAEHGARALELINEVQADVAIVDIDMPIIDGIELVKMLRKHGISIDIIFLTIHKDRSLLRSLPSLGVKGYVLKDSAPDEIVDCVKAVSSGERFVSSKLERNLDQGSAERGSPLAGLETLTLSELHVLRQVSFSRTSREIAKELGTSVRTVETHRYNIGSKLGLSGMHALLKFSLESKTKILNELTLRTTS